MADLDVAAGSADCQQLLGLKLLPLQDGSLATWQRLLPSGSQRRQQLVFVATEELEAVLVASHREWWYMHQLSIWCFFSLNVTYVQFVLVSGPPRRSE